MGNRREEWPSDAATWQRSPWSLSALVVAGISLAFAASLHVELLGLIAVGISLIAIRRSETAAISALIATIALLICGVVLSVIS